MDWDRISTVIDVFIKAQNVPNTDVIRRQALNEIARLNLDAVEKERPAEPELPLELKGRRV